ncbi:MAG: amino acid-binding protein [Chloroflexi bacterium]|nr:MAG: amino acid-binding protein [Actinobacteria bacterium 13_2_20CM_2_66_6]TMC03869.1 MAG: amino acid-binding protein [Chloroflexota bacterium]TME99099.1 MAG: amino acid-binding protein [Chloroflexota bacterium]TMG23599.1 MAG: amino acid-binding protein [Chloroflexota bacterium]
MPRAKQLTISVSDQPGRLGEIGAALGAKKVNIRALMATTEGGRGAVRIVVDKTAAAKKICSSMGWDASEDEVLAVTLTDNPGTLGKVSKKLGAAGVNIEYVYAGPGGGKRATVYMGVSDIKAALKAAR